MIAFRADRPCTLALLISLAVSPVAAQQVGPPIRLGPPGGAAPGQIAPAPPVREAPPVPTAPQPALTLPMAPAPQTPLTPLPPIPALPIGPAPSGPAPSGLGQFGPAPGSAIESSPLRPVGGDQLGIAPFPGDPIGADLWRGTTYATALALVRQVPAAPASPTLAALAKRVLTTAAVPPQTERPGGADLLIARLAKLSDLGDSNALEALLSVLPATAAGGAAQTVRVDQHWLAGRTTEACELVAREFERDRASPTWQQAQVACQAHAGQTGPAVLGAQLLREQGIEDAAFFTLIEVLGGTRGLQMDKGATLRPLHLPLMRKANRDVTLDLLAGATPAVLRSIAANGQVAAPLRLAAAERAAVAGALSADGFAQLLNQITLPGADVTNAAAVARSDPGPRGRAVLYRAARAQANSAQRVALTQAALDSARAAGVLLPVAAVFRPILAELTPGPETAPLTLNAVRGLAAGGDAAAARRWIAWAEGQAAGDQDLRLAAGLAQPWARLTGTEPLGGPAWAIWAESSRQVGGAGLDQRMGLFLGLVTALGDRPPAGVWAQALATPRDVGPPGPSAVPLAMLLSAAEAGRVGEAILAATVLVGDRPVGALGAAVAPQIVGALRRLGLAEPARLLALEAAATGGL